MSQEDLLDVLKDLVYLFRSGGLTQEEFQETKRLLLNQMQPGYRSRGTGDFGSSPITGKAHEGGGNWVPGVGQTLLGRYRLERLLGQGGMGQVFLCHDLVRQGEYALKLIHPHLAQYPDLRARFLRELQANERLTHPGIVRTYTLEEDPNNHLLFFTMEHVEGQTLEALLKQPRQFSAPMLPLSAMLALMTELVGILEYAHTQGVIHRDIKPSNIMVTRQGAVKLMDFGIAKVLEGTGMGRHTGFGGFVYYMAPEQLKGDGEVSFAADVFSLGAIVYQMLTGEIPMGALVPPSQFWPVLGSEVDSIVLRAMEPRIQYRYRHPREFWDVLAPQLMRLASPAQGSSASDVLTRWAFPPLVSSAHSVPSPGLHLSPSETQSHASEEERLVPLMTEESFLSSLGDVLERATENLLSSKSFTELDDSLEEESFSPPKPTRSATFPGIRTFRPSKSESGSPGNIPVLPSSELPEALLSEPPYTEDLGSVEANEMISLEPQTSWSVPDYHHESSRMFLEIFEEKEVNEQEGEVLVPGQALELELELEDEVEVEASSFGAIVFSYKRRTFEELVELPGVAHSLEEEVFFAKDGMPLLRFVKIPAGSFWMGSRRSASLSYKNEVPQRFVHLEEYWMARTPLTNRVWLKFVEESGYHNEDIDYLYHWRGGRPHWDELDHPVVYVSFADVSAFCSFYDVVLPSEAQWEKAARGTEGQIWPWGNQKPQANVCNFLGANLHTTTPVNAFLEGASPYGVLDCCGNVWEWCRDRWCLDWLEQMGETPTNPTFVHGHGPERSIRGGCFRLHGRGVRCAARSSSSERSEFLGARICLEEGIW